MRSIRKQTNYYITYQIRVNNEFHINWEFPKTFQNYQLSCKSLLDRLIIDHTEKKIILVDLKTTADVNNFKHSIEEYDYRRQLAYYWLAIHWYFKYELQKDIAEYINKRLEEIHNENTANIQEVMEYLTSVMRGTSKANVLALAGDGYQEVIAKPPDEKERLKAAELLGKRFGMFKDNVDITSNGKTVIVDDIDEG